MAMIPLIASIGIVPALTFAQTDASAGCKGGFIHLKNPNTGATICAKQSDVSKYVNQGWIALDEMSGMKDSTSDCKTGYIHLKNPNTGAVACEKPSKARNLVAQGWTPSHSPHEQFSNDIAPHELVCRQLGHKLIIRDSGIGNCVSSDTHAKMLAAGIGAKAITDKECTGGLIHLKNPNTGAIICEKQSDTSKYVNQGWVALDKVPAMEKTDPAVCKGGEVKMTDPATGTIICKNQDEAQKFLNQGWVVVGDPLIDSVQSSDVFQGEPMAEHMATIETTHVIREMPFESNTYQVTFKVLAGNQHLENVQINVVSDSEQVTGIIDSLAARADATLQIRIHAIDAGSIYGAISNYNLK